MRGNAWAGPVDGICYDLYFDRLPERPRPAAGSRKANWDFTLPHGTPGIAIYRWLTDDGTCTLQTLIGTDFAQWGVLLGNGDATPPPVGTPATDWQSGRIRRWLRRRTRARVTRGARAQAYAAAPAVMQTPHAGRAAVGMARRRSTARNDHRYAISGPLAISSSAAARPRRRLRCGLADLTARVARVPRPRRRR